MIDAVLGVQVFGEFFEQYRNSTVPSATAALDYLKEFELLGQPAQHCLETLLECGEQVALIQEMSGTKRIVSPEHAVETLMAKYGTAATKKPLAPLEANSPAFLPTPSPALEAPASLSDRFPTVHVDVQIHISADAKPEQIEQVFASMAKHLYNKD